MLNIPCDRAISCPGVNGLNTDFPITNYSSEEPDRELFVGLNWGWDLNLPILGTNWTHSNCLGICVSSISQEDADLCAARANLLCLDDPGGNPELGDGGGGLPPLAPPFTTPTNAPTRQLWYNEPQSCTVLCTDGKANTYTVPARTFVSYSLFQSNSMAHSYACKQAEKLRTMCFGDLFDWACLGQPDIEDVLEVTPGTHPPYTFNVSSGSLPDGLNLYPDTDTSTLLAGTPTKAGTFAFSIRATDVLGQTNEKQFTIDILGVENPDAIPHAKCDQPYTYTFSPAGGHGPYTFLEDIANPPPGGLILNLNGTLAGIPTVLPETRVMKFLLTDSSTPPRSCMIAVDITTDGPKVTNVPPDCTKCTNYGTFTFTTIPTPCTFTGTVPGGLKMTSAGVVTGVPDVSGAQAFNITVTDVDGNTNTYTFNKTVAGDGDTCPRSVLDTGVWPNTQSQDLPGAPAGSIAGTFPTGGDCDFTITLPVGWIGTFIRTWNTIVTHCNGLTDYSVTGEVWVYFDRGSDVNVNYSGRFMNLGVHIDDWLGQTVNDHAGPTSTGGAKVSYAVGCNPSLGNTELNIKLDSGFPLTHECTCRVVFTIRPLDQP